MDGFSRILWFSISDMILKIPVPPLKASEKCGFNLIELKQVVAPPPNII